jgi:hypothetical protein
MESKEVGMDKEVVVSGSRVQKAGNSASTATQVDNGRTQRRSTDGRSRPSEAAKSGSSQKSTNGQNTVNGWRNSNGRKSADGGQGNGTVRKNAQGRKSANGRKSTNGRRKSVRVTAEGRVWELLVPHFRMGDFTLKIREVASRTDLSLGSVQRTHAWYLYTTLKKWEVMGRIERFLELGRRFDG